MRLFIILALIIVWFGGSALGSENCVRVVAEFEQYQPINIPNDSELLMGIVAGLSFAHGYAKKSNLRNPNGFKDMTLPEMIEWMASWCRDNHSKSQFEAMSALITPGMKFPPEPNRDLRLPGLQSPVAR